MRRRRMKRADRPSVWLANDGDMGLRHVFGDRDSAMRWLLVQHGEALRDAARTDEYWRRDYVDRMATEADPKMRAYYEQAAKETRELVGPIEDHSPMGAGFNRDNWNRVSISEERVVVYEPDSISEPTEVAKPSATQGD